MYKYKNKSKALLFTDAQLRAELNRCEFCEEKPCRQGCPVNCSPADFIMAAREMTREDFSRAAALIMRDNPLGGICGMVCPDKFCMAECSHKLFDDPVRIPDLQAEIVWRARQGNGIAEFNKKKSTVRKIAVAGGGPAGLAAAAALAQRGHRVEIYESRHKAGGMGNLIPPHRLDREMLAGDIDFVKSLGDITLKISSEVEDLEKLSGSYDAVIASVGLWQPILPGIPGEELAVGSIEFLSGEIEVSGNVAVIGGGATALDCAVKAVSKGASRVEMFCLESNAEMPLTGRERKELLDFGIEVNPRTGISSVSGSNGRIDSVDTVKLKLDGDTFSLEAVKEIPGTTQKRSDIDMLIIAIGCRPSLPSGKGDNVFFAGDCVNGPSTVVEAVAAGKNAALEVESFLEKTPAPELKDKKRNKAPLDGYIKTPVSLESVFFGRKIINPFLLSAAPPSDGYDQMKKAYESGWAGGVMKTAFASGPIHIPGEYMHAFSGETYGNCDNVSGHLIGRVSGEISRLVREYPDRLTIASTGGPVTGNDDEDMKGWQSNTKTLEEAGAMAIEYSLSCPQGGEGTEGDIVAQSPELTSKVIDWVMQVSSPDIPKLFKLTAAVTSIESIMKAVKKILEKYPEKKAGVTLANTYPSLGFQDRGRKEWENGVVLGMSGAGTAPISYFTLARAVPVGVAISGNGGPMNYRQAAHFLALGVESVQFCTIIMKYGYGIIDDLTGGLSFLMKQRGFSSVARLIGAAQPGAITDFMELSAEKKISSLIDKDLCLKCGNCVRCPYMAIELDSDTHPETDPEKCIGCSICVQKCFSGALEMRERTAQEKKQLKED